MSQVDLEDQCITLHPGFRDVCLNRWVLEIASLALKTKAGKSYRTLFSQGLKRVNQSELLVATMLLHEIPCLLLKIYIYFLKHDVQVHSKYNSNAVKKKKIKALYAYLTTTPV